MKILLTISFLLSLFILQSNIIASDGKNQKALNPCTELDNLITNIDGLNNKLDKLKPEEVDAEMVKTLKALAESLQKLGKELPSLQAPAAKLQKAFNNKELRLYQEALDLCANELEKHFQKTCKK